MSMHRVEVPVRTLDTAPREAIPILHGAREKFGFVPNLLGVLANAPALLEGYLALGSIFDRSTLTPTERQIVLLAASFENGCDYCMAAHSVIAGMQRVDSAVVQALRNGSAIADPRLEALRGFAKEVVASRGRPEPTVIDRFLTAGYTSGQALEVVLGVGLKTLSNYANHLARTPLDPAFASARWEPPTCESGGCA